MQHEHANSGSKVWRPWHEERQRARETAMSEEEFSPQEIEDYDLDTAEIDGSDNPDSFTTEPYGEGEESVDYREADPRF